jgi:hypothetical protein
MVEVGWGIMVCCDVVAWRFGRDCVYDCSSRPFEVFLGCCSALWMMYLTLVGVNINVPSLIFSPLQQAGATRSFFLWMLFGNALAMID